MLKILQAFRFRDIIIVSWWEKSFMSLRGMFEVYRKFLCIIVQRFQVASQHLCQPKAVCEFNLSWRTVTGFFTPQDSFETVQKYTYSNKYLWHISRIQCAPLNLIQNWRLLITHLCHAKTVLSFKIAGVLETKVSRIQSWLCT